jgi:hypothetical protein
VTPGEVADAVAASSLSELCWVDEAGRPQARGVVALVLDERPVLAFTYADEAVARGVARSERVALALTETRSTGRAFLPLLVSGRPRLVEDATGERYVADLAVQELHRYPPSRLFVDSPLLMREHWWYLPRLLVEIDVDSADPLPQRTGTHDHLLVVAHGPAPVVRRAGVRERSGDTLALSVEGQPPPAGPAVLFGQDASFPDLERWSQWRYLGEWDGFALTVEEAPSSTGLGSVPGLVQRWRRQRDLKRRCVEAIPRP